MDANEFLELGYRLLDEASHGRRSVLSERLREAQKELAGQMTLATLVQAGDG
jgi:hypothetical protein